MRQRGEEFSPSELELEYQKGETLRDPETGEELVSVPEDPLAGLNKLLDALEAMNGQSLLDKRGELRTQFYLHLSRKPGERVADYASRFRTAISDLKEEGVKLPDAEVGWWFKEKLGLDALRKQLLETALQGTEAYSTIESESLRLFRDLHSQDPLFRKMDRGVSGKLTIRRMFAPSTASSGATSTSMSSSRRPSVSSSTTSSSAPGGRRFPPRHVHVAEAADEDPGDPLEESPEAAEPQDEATEDYTLEEVLQTEVENLAEEIAQAEQEGVDPLHLEALENGIEASAEALVSMREARQKLAEVRKDRGFRGPSSSSPMMAKARAKAAISAKKASGKHVCFNCGLSGHWAGDAECTKPGAGLARPKGKPAKQVRIAEAVGSHEIAQAEQVEAPANEILMLSSTAVSLSGALRASAGDGPMNETIGGGGTLR